MKSFVSSQPQLLSQMNERMVLRVLQANGPRSRAEVARLAGVTAPTVSKAVSSLLRSGMLEEFDSSETMRGRPAKRLRLAEDTAQVVGVVVDSPTCRIVTTGLDGRVGSGTHAEFKTPRTYRQLVEDIVEQVSSLQLFGGVKTLGIGISMPGLFDSREGRSILSPNVPITNDSCLGRDLTERLGLECVVLQESDALCLAERHYGLARGVDDFAMLDASTGIGLGVLIGGRLLKGKSGLAGEIGHLPMMEDGLECGCGRRGCLETIASDRALARLVSQRVGQEMSIEQIVEQVRTGRLDVTAEWEAVERPLAFALVTTINLFNPQTLFVHSRMLDIDDAFFERLIQRTASMALAPSFVDCRIERARGSKREGAVAGIIEHLTDARVSESHAHSVNVL
ncbi:N-acetylglucosamine repressor [Symmachiella dynata]|uniref:ROK family transcriptional regulator n=1 Tax=Symmachiella dynata TaxID=2527995 RepID=UPI00118AE576|nr:ROK family transcriptional regulator [Symmachiella dynata]QDT49221.1 N-acetylglucosamine repressor [Symmachiella dynata]